MYARFVDIGMGETLEDGVDLGKVTGTLEKVGVQVLDSEDKMRNVGDIMEDLMEVWAQLDSTQKNAIATTLAGKYQLTRFEALMNRSDLYEDYKFASENAEGTMDEMQEEYQNSLAGRLNTLQASFEGLMNSVFDTSDFYGMIDAVSTLLDTFNNLIDAIGGTGSALTVLGAIGTKVFNAQLSRGLEGIYNRVQNKRNNEDVGVQQLLAEGLKTSQGRSNKDLLDFAANTQANRSLFTEEELRYRNEQLSTAVKLRNEAINAEEQLEQKVNETNRAYALTNKSNDDVYRLQQVNSKLTGEVELQSDQQVSTITRNELVGSDRFQSLKTNSGAAIGQLEKLKVKLNEVQVTEGKVDAATARMYRQFARKEVVGNIKAVITALGATSDEADQIETQLKELTPKSLRDIKSIEEVINNLIVKMRELHGWTKETEKSTNVTISQNFDAETERFQTAQQQDEASTAQRGMLDESLNVRSRISSIVDFTQSVSSLAFAWQSFQSLGSIWSNADLDTGQKIEQIILNMAITLPMLVTGIAEFSTSWKNIKGVINDLTVSLIAQKVALSGGAEAAAAYAAQLTLTQRAGLLLSSGISKLGAGIKNAATAMAGFIGANLPLVLIAAAASTAAIALGAMAEQEAQMYKIEKEQSSTSMSSYNDFETQVDSFNKLYDQYKKTRQVSDEFRAVSEKLVSTLGDESAQVALAADNYDRLKESISNATVEQQNRALKDAEIFLEGSNKRSLEGSFFGIANGSIYQDLGKAGQHDLTLLEDLRNAENENNPDKAIGAIRKRIEFYNEELDKIDSEIAKGGDTADLENRRTEIAEIVGSYQEALNTEDIADRIETLGNQAEIKAQQLQDSLDGLDYQGIVDAYFDSSNGISAYLEQLGPWSEQLSWMIEQTTNEVAKRKLQLEQSRVLAGENLYNIGKGLAESGNITTYNASGQPITMSSEDIGTATRDTIMRQISELNLTDDQQLSLLATIDENASIDEIQKQLQSIKQDPAVLSELEFQPNFTNRIDNTPEQTTNLLKESKISENAFNRMSATMYEDESGYYQSRKNEIQEALDDINSSNFNDYVKGAENAEDATERLKEELAGLGEQAKDSSAINVRLNKGVANLTKDWKEYGAVLKDDASKGTADWYNTVGKLDEAMSDILNVDVGTLSNGFYENAEAINAMERAAKGDAAAIDDLRTIANEDIIMHLSISGVSAEQADTIRQDLLAQSQNLQAYLDSMPLEERVKASLDDSEYVQMLNKMLANSQITAEQATAMLSSIGMEGTVTTKKVQGKTPAIRYTFKQNLVYDDRTGIPMPEEGSYMTMEPSITYIPSEMDIPVIQGAHYTGPGVTSVGGFSSGRVGGSKKGGGGGGSKNKYKPKEKHEIESDIDRYEKVDTKLAAIGNDYERIADEQDRLTGHELADNMNEQIGLLEKQIDLQEQKQKIQNEEKAELQRDLSKKFGIKFEEDSEGKQFISNYAEVQKKLENNVNKLIKKYNNTKSEKGQASLETDIEAAQKKLDDFNKTYQRYDELVSEDMKETKKEIEDLKDSIEDIRIEAFKTGVEAVDNIKDVQEQLIDFNAVFSGRESDDPFREMAVSAQKLGKYIELDTEELNRYYDTIIKNSEAVLYDPNSSEGQKGWAQRQKDQANLMKNRISANGTGYIDLEFANLDNILKEARQYESTGYSDIFGENSAELYETLNAVFESAAQKVIDYEAQVEELKDAILDSIDDVDERMQDRLDQYEDITDELEHQAKIIEMVQGDRSYDQINMALMAQNKNYQQQIVEIQSNIAAWKELQKSMVEGSEEWKSVQSKITEGQKQINGLIESNLENLNEIYKNNVSNWLDNWTANTPLGSDLDWMEDQWELINRNADYYLDDVNAAYNIQKLQGEYLELLDGTNDLHIQQQITEQMGAQLGYLREKEKLSEYDVAYAEAQLQILQKRIALEEAQRNKSQMKLKRDSQGNYSYVYTANQENVASSENDLLDAQNNAYNLSKDQMKETQQDSLSALADAKNTLNQIWNDANLTLQEKTERSKIIIDSLKEYLTGTQEQLSESEKNIVNDFLGMVDLMSEENAERLGETYDELVQKNYKAFDQVDTRFSTSITDWLNNLDEFKAESDSLNDHLIDNAQNWETEVQNTGELVNETFKNMTESINETVNMTDALTQSQINFGQAIQNDLGTISKYEEELQNQRSIAAGLKADMDEYKSKVEEAATRNTAAELEKIANQPTGGGRGGNQNNSGSGQDGNGKDGKSSGSGGKGNGYAGTNYSQGALVEGIAGNIWTYGTWGNGEDRIARMREKFGKSKGNKIYDDVQALFNGHPQYGYDYNPTKWKKDGYGYYKKFAYSKFDTGGYTGTWSETGQADNGKLAFLHQKELVLNASDTENMLAMIDAVRQTVNVLKNNSLSAIFSNTGSKFTNGESQKLEQQVNIDATFPNVQDSNEIQDALLTLIDQTPQYIYRTK